MWNGWEAAAAQAAGVRQAAGGGVGGGSSAPCVLQLPQVFGQGYLFPCAVGWVTLPRLQPDDEAAGEALAGKPRLRGGWSGLARGRGARAKRSAVAGPDACSFQGAQPGSAPVAAPKQSKASWSGTPPPTPTPAPPARRTPTPPPPPHTTGTLARGLSALSSAASPPTSGLVAEQRDLVVMVVSERQAIKAAAGDPMRLLRIMEEDPGGPQPGGEGAGGLRAVCVAPGRRERRRHEMCVAIAARVVVFAMGVSRASCAVAPGPDQSAWCRGRVTAGAAS